MRAWCFLQIRAATNTDMPLTYTATGLPYGLHMNSAGHITGSPATTAGTWHPQVRVSDPLGTVSASFTWQISSAAGPVKGYDAKCVDDSGGRTANGNKIDLWTCTGKTPQKITFSASRELQVVPVAGRDVGAGLRDPDDRPARLELVARQAVVHRALDVDRRHVDIRGVVEPGA